jgi:hypothetical protein
MLVWSQYPPTLQILQKNSKKSCLGCNGLIASDLDNISDVNNLDVVDNSDVVIIGDF